MKLRAKDRWRRLSSVMNELHKVVLSLWRTLDQKPFIKDEQLGMQILLESLFCWIAWPCKPHLKQLAGMHVESRSRSVFFSDTPRNTSKCPKFSFLQLLHGHIVGRSFRSNLGNLVENFDISAASNDCQTNHEHERLDNHRFCLTRLWIAVNASKFAFAVFPDLILCDMISKSLMVV